MAVVYDAVSESHTGTTGDVSHASFTWNHAGAASGVKGILIFVFNSSSATDSATTVTYDSVNVPAVTGGLAADTANEAANCKAYFLGSGVSQGTKAVVVNRTSTTDEYYAVAITVTAGIDTETAGVTLQQENQAPAQASIDDGSVSGTNSVRFAGAFYGGSGVPGAGAQSTAIIDIDFGLRTIQVVRETTAGTGARNVGFTNATSDDWACVLLAVREKSYSPTVALNTPNDTATGVSTTPDLVFTGTDLNSQELEYNVQVDTANTFDSVSGNFNLEYVDLSLKKTGTPTDNLLLNIVSTSFAGSSLGQASIAASSLTTSQATYRFTFATPISLTAGTKYYMTLTRSGARDTINVVSWYLSGTGNSVYSGGGSSQEASGSWSAESTTNDAVFIIYNASIVAIITQSVGTVALMLINGSGGTAEAGGQSFTVPSNTPLLSKYSVTPDATFAGTGDPHPWPSGNQVTYTVQGADALTAGVDYWWRVAGTDPSGSNVYGAWPTAFKFTTAAAGGGSPTPATGFMTVNTQFWG